MSYCNIDIRKKSNDAIEKEICSCGPGTGSMKIHQEFDFKTLDIDWISSGDSLLLEILGAIFVEGGGNLIYLGGQRIAKGITERKLPTLPGCIDNYPDLENLVIDGVHIKDLSVLSGKKKLKALEIKNSKIDTLETIPDGLSSLEKLSVSNSDISRIEALDRFPRLKELDLSGNKITKIEGLDSLKNLEELDLDHNKIKKVENLKHLGNLKRIELNGNKIREIGDIVSMDSLTDVDLRNNNLKKVDVGIAESLIARGTDVDTGGRLKAIGNFLRTIRS